MDKNVHSLGSRSDNGVSGGSGWEFLLSTKLTTGQGCLVTGMYLSKQCHNTMESKEGRLVTVFAVLRLGIALATISATCLTAGRLATPPYFVLSTPYGKWSRGSLFNDCEFELKSYRKALLPCLGSHFPFGLELDLLLLSLYPIFPSRVHTLEDPAFARHRASTEHRPLTFASESQSFELGNGTKAGSCSTCGVQSGRGKLRARGHLLTLVGARGGQGCSWSLNPVAGSVKLPLKTPKTTTVLPMVANANPIMPIRSQVSLFVLGFLYPPGCSHRADCSTSIAEVEHATHKNSLSTRYNIFRSHPYLP
ncbi:hypothetical protein B0T21DRAFT_423388 [Apiosordaria backusii]|uniref:Uncharacterized protein n=1 Tax=Apiosordaria backusii TaxID=314023 RepID=A0AA40E3T7_9PEZI|nr:hypothetical protein B0T21DRAFT_423388 [Apiosordaria backusii]